MFVLRDAISPDACARLRAAIDRSTLTPAEIFADGFRVDPAVRRSCEADVDPNSIADVTRLLAGIRPQVSSFFAIPLSASEGPGFLRYVEGGFYASHRDVAGEAPLEFPRRISVVLFLTTNGSGVGCCEGGALRLYTPRGDGAEPIPVDIPPAAGTLVAFPATWLHEVLPVIAGVRDVIVDWFY
jgi:predicted 2-oxoglutarate/Fe(II)-dependent dioxygenase YbiX